MSWRAWHIFGSDSTPPQLAEAVQRRCHDERRKRGIPMELLMILTSGGHVQIVAREDAAETIVGWREFAKRAASLEWTSALERLSLRVPDAPALAPEPGSGWADA